MSCRFTTIFVNVDPKIRIDSIIKCNHTARGTEMMRNIGNYDSQYYRFLANQAAPAYSRAAIYSSSFPKKTGKCPKYSSDVIPAETGIQYKPMALASDFCRNNGFNAYYNTSRKRKLALLKALLILVLPGITRPVSSNCSSSDFPLRWYQNNLKLCLSCAFSANP